MSEYFNAPPQLKSLPTTRAAYSDRSAWMMSEMSALAYLSFEGDNRFKDLLGMIAKVAKVTRQRRSGIETAGVVQALEKEIKAYIDARLSSNEAAPPELEKLRDALASADFKLVRTFNEGDTQAFLAKRDVDRIAVLAFRGTEANSWKDVKTDLNARFYKGQNGVKVHTGFRNAYDQVGEQVRTAVDDLPDGYSLYITGHSLGGALAVIATKQLERDSLAACYTFGSPRVGDEEFGEAIRAPIYRIVNAADGVPRVPPSWATYCIAFVVSFVRPRWAEALERNFCGYLHQGDMRYLTACDGDISKLKVIPNLSMPFRVVRLGRRLIVKGVSVAGKDHRISEYQRKLKPYARRRVGAADNP